MAYTKFSSENADYILQLNTHIARNKHNVFEGIDALVIEAGGNSSQIDQVFHRLAFHPQWNLPIEIARQEKVPVYVTDVNLTRLGFLVSFPSEFLNLPVSFMALGYSFTEKELSKYFVEMLSAYGAITQSPLEEGRNMIGAEKIEGFVVPHLKERTQKDKPVIGLVYGGAHVGLKTNLQSGRRRKYTNWMMRNLSWKPYGFFVEEDLNRVWEANYGVGGWDVAQHQTDLFKIGHEK